MQEPCFNKQAIISEYLTKRVSYRELEKKYGMSYVTIRRWVIEYQGKSSKVSKDKKVKQSEYPTSADKLPTDVKQLQEELRNARLHNELLNAIIDIAEEQLGVDIRKKSGPKQ